MHGGITNIRPEYTHYYIGVILRFLSFFLFWSLQIVWKVVNVDLFVLIVIKMIKNPHGYNENTAQDSSLSQQTIFTHCLHAA